MYFAVLSNVLEKLHYLNLMYSLFRYHERHDCRWTTITRCNVPTGVVSQGKICLRTRASCHTRRNIWAFAAPYRSGKSSSMPMVPRYYFVQLLIFNCSFKFLVVHCSVVFVFLFLPLIYAKWPRNSDKRF